MSLQEFNESRNHPLWRTRLQISDSSMWTFRNDVQHLKLRTRRCLLLRPNTTFMHACKTAGNSRNVLSAVTPQLQMISAVYPQAAKVLRVRKVLSLSGQPGFCSYDSCPVLYSTPCFPVCSDTLTMPFWQDCTAIRLLSTGPLDGGKSTVNWELSFSETPGGMAERMTIFYSPRVPFHWEITECIDPQISTKSRTRRMINEMLVLVYQHTRQQVAPPSLNLKHLLAMSCLNPSSFSGQLQHLSAMKQSAVFHI